jgi:DNA repair protein RecN (Recombination protein N)
MIRSDMERANLEALFSMPPDHKQEIIQLLDSEGLYEGEPNILLNREIRREGRNIARINGRVVNVSLMKELGAYLVDIHGQSEHLSLLTVRQHLQLLDRFADDRAALDDYQQSYHVLKATQQELKDLRQAEQDAARMSDLLNYQIQEIDAAKLRVGEEDELREELSRLANAEKLSSLAKQAYSLLEEDSPETPAINSMLGQVVSAVRALANIDKSLEPLADQCENISSLSSDTSRDLQNYLEAIEYNPKRLEQTENRLALINTLKRKYGENEQAILDFAEKARLQLNRITNAEERIGELEALEAAQLAETARKALTLSEARKSAAAAMGGQVERELADLHMAGARFAVDMQFKAVENGLPLDDGSQVKFDERGIDQVEFLIAPNPGEGLKPLVKIASGGETSRLMLALKNVLAKADTIPTLIFDEIDQGIGGRIGAMVGEKLWQLGNRHQVLCVTHLPQLAAYGTHHYHVYKQVQAGRTMSKVEELTADRRRVELALMFGGDSEANQSAAQEALDSAEMRKKEFINLL